MLCDSLKCVLCVCERFLDLLSYLLIISLKWDLIKKIQLQSLFRILRFPKLYRAVSIIYDYFHVLLIFMMEKLLATICSVLNSMIKLNETYKDEILSVIHLLYFRNCSLRLEIPNNVQYFNGLKLKWARNLKTNSATRSISKICSFNLVSH